MNFDPDNAETRALKILRARLNISRWLRALRESGKISSEQYAGGLEHFELSPGTSDWARFVQCLGGLGGLLLFASGLCFLLYWHWHDLHRYAQIGSVQALFIGMAVFAVVFWNKWYSHLAYLGAALSIGAVLAAFVRAYPSGWETWEVFMAWSVALLPLAAIRPRVTVVFLLWITSSLWLAFYLHDVVELSLTAALFAPESVLFQFLFFMCCEVFCRVTRNRRSRFDQFRLLTRLAGAAAMASLTLYAVDRVMLNQFLDRFFIINLSAFSVVAIYIQLILIVACFYFLVKQDMFVVALCIFSPLVFLGAQLTVIVNDYEAGIGRFSVLVLAFVYTALFLAGAQLVLIVRRYLRHKVCSVDRPDDARPPICSPIDFIADAESKTKVRDWMLDSTRSESADIDTFFEQETSRQEQSQPWHIELLISVVLWSAAGAISYFLLTSLPNDKSIMATSFLGAMLVVAGVFMSYRYDRHMIMKQVSLVVILTGMCSLAYYAQKNTMRVMGLYAFILALLWLSLKPSVAKTLAAISCLYCLLFYLISAPAFQLAEAPLLPESEFFHTELTVIVFTLVIGLILGLIMTAMTKPLAARPQAGSGAYFYNLKKSGALGVISFALLLSAFDLMVIPLPGELNLLKTPSLIVMVALLLFTLRLAASVRRLRAVYLLLGCALIALAWWAPGISLALTLIMLAKYQGYYALNLSASVYLCGVAFFFFYKLGLAPDMKAALLLGSGALLAAGAYLFNRALGRLAQQRGGAGHA